MTSNNNNNMYAAKFQVEKVAKFAAMERKATFEFYKKITLAKSLLIGKHIAWYDGEGREELAKCAFKFDFSKTSDGIIKTAKAGEQTEMHAANENCEFVHFAAHFYGIKKSDSYDARKVFTIEKDVINAFLEQIQSEDNVLPMSNKGLIKFAKQLAAGVSADEQNSDEAEKKEAKAESKKALNVLRSTVVDFQLTENADGKLEIKGDIEVGKALLRELTTKLNAYAARQAKKAAKAEVKTAEQQAKLDMETA